MRVVVVVPWEPWRIGDGVILPLFHHLHELADRHDLTVLAAGGPRAAEQRVAGPQHGLPEGVVVRWFGTDSSPAADYARRRVASLRRAEPAHVLFVERAGLLRSFEEETRHADVVHLVGWGTAQLAARTDVPAVHVAVDPWAASWRNRRLSPARRLADVGQRRLVLRHEQRHYPRCSAVVVVAEPDRELLHRQVPGARVAVVPNGVSPGEPPRPRPAGHVLGFHGSFETQANVDAARALVQDLWPLVTRAVPDAEVLLVGRHAPPEVRALARPGVTVATDVASVRDELDRMSVHVSWMPSGLGLKNKVLEAMAAGRPVVTNPRGSSGIGAGGGVSVAADPAAAASRIAELLTDTALWQTEADAARARVVQEFSWARSAALVEALWEQAVR